MSINLRWGVGKEIIARFKKIIKAIAHRNNFIFSTFTFENEVNYSFNGRFIMTLHDDEDYVKTVDISD